MKDKTRQFVVYAGNSKTQVELEWRKVEGWFGGKDGLSQNDENRYDAWGGIGLEIRTANTESKSPYDYYLCLDLEWGGECCLDVLAKDHLGLMLAMQDLTPLQTSISRAESLQDLAKAIGCLDNYKDANNLTLIETLARLANHVRDISQQLPS